MINMLAVFVGGGIGASCRYIITKISTKFFGFAHFGTFAANIIGCFVIGYIFGLTMEKSQVLPTSLKLFLTAGFLGGLTTFSTFSCESFCFLKEGKILHCAFYMLASFIVGLTATFAGYILSKQTA